MTEMPPAPLLSVIISAFNEERYIGACLGSLLDQDPVPCDVEVIVSANACTDRTEEIVEGFVPRFAARGWTLNCLSSPVPGKPAALNRADAVARGDLRAYLDADIVCSPGLLAEIARRLDTPAALYATGRLRVARAASWITRAYARLWCRLPFMKSGAVGAGFFAVNAPGRARWGAFPDIISDDTFVRLQFAPGESRETLGLTVEEVLSITGIGEGLTPKKRLTVTTDTGKSFEVIARLDTPQEVEYLEHGGILQYVLRQMAASV